jgi:glycosyltransferase involved in cell wall biosynthesis
MGLDMLRAQLDAGALAPGSPTLEMQDGRRTRVAALNDGGTRVTPAKVVHIINSFEPGGAEAMLCNLVLRMDRARFEPSVVALIDDLQVAGPLLGAGIPVTTMGMRPGVPDPRGFVRLIAHLRRERPAVVQTWMDHSNLIGGVAARMACRARVVWGIHHSDHVRGVAKRSTLITVWACARLSNRVPARIVCCSEHSCRLYWARGFAADRLAEIPNGFDTGAFRPDPAARLAVRAELAIDPDAPLVGLVARYDPLKDHDTFFHAAAMLVRARPDVRFLLCGNRVDKDNPALVAQVRALGLAGHCRLLGMRRDAARIHAALDVATSSSISEAFPLAVGEAMACGVPCAVTDVGDSARIVGPTGRVVPPRDPAALAGAWADLLGMGVAARAELGAAARQRVRELFDLGAVTRRYEDLYEELAAREPAPGPPPGPPGDPDRRGEPCPSRSQPGEVA